MITKSPEETEAVGTEFARRLYPKKPVFVTLEGVVGAGKTTFLRGFIREWCALSGEQTPEAITSPTYNIARTYGRLAHLDLYRVKNIAELEAIGVDHYFGDFDCCVVEWMELVPEATAYAPKTRTRISIEIQGPTLRAIEVL